MFFKVGRNDICPCGSGKKYKVCCMNSLNHTISNRSDMDDNRWIKVRETEGILIEKHLKPYDMKHVLPQLRIQAFEDFCCEFEFDEQVSNAILNQSFLEWFYFDWVSEAFPIKLALKYMRENKYKLTAYEANYIDTICHNTYYSVYRIVNIEIDISITLLDVFLGTTHVVRERKGTHYLKLNQLIYTRILSYDNQHMMVGMFPYSFNEKLYTEILDFRDDTLEDYEIISFNTELLKNLSYEIREMCMENLFDMFAPPILHNTDDEPIVLCTLKYKLNIKPEEALKKLMPLRVDDDFDDILKDAKKDSKGNIKKIEFDWLKKKNKKTNSYSNTVMGTIVLEKNTLEIHVNSIERSTKIRTLINKLLKDDVSFVSVDHQKVDALRQNFAHEETNENENLNENLEDIFSKTPEGQSLLKNVANKYWEEWFDIPIPMLKNETPRQAAKTEQGRERLESLLIYYQENDDPNNPFRADIKALRKKLKM